MQDEAKHGQRARTLSRVARELISLTERVASSPTQFAALFGRSPTWTYRQIYAGRIRPIADCGRLLIPHTEVEAILARCCEYNPAQEVSSGEGCQPGNPSPAREARYARKQARFDKTAAVSKPGQGGATTKVKPSAALPFIHNQARAES